MTNVEKFNNQSIGEEIGNSISHGMGALLAIAGTVILIVKAAIYNNAWGVVSASIFGATMIILYTMSTLYHSITNKKAKHVLQVFDHCSIFLLITGTYAPFCLVTLRGKIGWWLFGFNLFFTVTGIVLNAISVKKWHKLSLVCYLCMGWSIVFAIKPLVFALPFYGLMLLVAGGVFYTIGIIFYLAKKHRYMHMIWHFFVLLGSIFHYFCILFFVM